MVTNTFFKDFMNSQQKFLSIQGRITAESFQQSCIENGINPHQAVFIFPGNISHHGAYHTLYSKKYGGGLGIPAGELGELGIAVLSIPTTGMSIVDNEKHIPPLAITAIADIWKAIGFGMSIVLPVRKPSGIKFFINTFNDGTEPSFWGENERTPNVKLAEYYLKQLSFIQDFLQGEKQAPPEEFNDAFKLGREMQLQVSNNLTADAWFK